MGRRHIQRTGGLGQLGKDRFAGHESEERRKTGVDRTLGQAEDSGRGRDLSGNSSASAKQLWQLFRQARWAMGTGAWG